MRRQRTSGLLTFVLLGLLGGAVLTALQLPPAVGTMSRRSGQSVVPVYAGWFESPDGQSIGLAFGYLNRNTSQELDIPVGPDNKIEPGPPDRGQPTHFLAGTTSRTSIMGVQEMLFAVKVPKSDKTEYKWTLTSGGTTYSIPAVLNPLYLIAPFRTFAKGSVSATTETPQMNTPPILKFAPGGEAGVGPFGLTTSIKATVGKAVTLDTWVTDDGFPFGEGAVLAVDWSRYRGSGPVTVAKQMVPVANGKASTSATFGAPGEYTLRAFVTDGSSEGMCCWTNGYVNVSVGPATSR